jgi:signal transduction histidine kinase
VFDVVLGVSFALALSIQIGLDPNFDGSALEIAAVSILSTALVWRRVAPLAALAVLGIVGTLAQTGLTTEIGGATFFAGFLLAVYSVARHSPGRRSLVGLGLALLTVGSEVLASDFILGELFISVVVVAGSWVAGHALRDRELKIEEIEDRATQLERRRAEESRLAVEAERVRIARELHDIVAHSVSVMVVQAGGAEQVLDREPEQARSALGSIQRTGNEAIAELQRLLSVLRAAPDGSDRAPQPGISELGALVEQARGAGLAVELSTEGAPRPLPPGIDLCAFRVVQEALTNAIKHANGARCQVALSYGAQALDVEVVDDGTGDRGEDSSGHGLEGMRERVALYGGEVVTSKPDTGGFRVLARLPAPAGTR